MRHLSIILSASIVLATMAGCSGPTPDQRVGTTPPADESNGDEPNGDPGATHGSDSDHGGHHSMAMSIMGGDDADLRPLDAALEVTQEPDAEPKAVEQLGPAGPTVMFTGAMKGYIEPCGCTLDVLLGGIDRVSGYVRTQQQLNPGALMIDTGSMLFEDTQLPPNAVAQAMRKARLLLQGHLAMGTVSTTPGPYDLALGVDVYRSAMRESGLPVTVANLRASSDDALLGEPSRVFEVSAGEGSDPVRIGLVGVVDPAAVAGFDDVKASDPVVAAAEAVDGIAADVDAVVVVVQGDVLFARELADAVPNIDFVVVGYEPRKTDEVSVVGDARVLEPYSQGRHVGVLKLYRGEGEITSETTWENARLGSAEELARLDRRIAYVDSALDRLPPARTSDENAFVKKQRAELEKFEQQRLELSADSVSVPESGPGFAWFSVAMDPGYPLDLALHERKQRYTEGLEALYAELALEVPEPEPGQAYYVGGEACVDCHEDAHDVWMSTPHMIGYKTLEKKGKQFDPDCVECHVTGYGMPGGSIVGQVEGLEGIQCESCHGPGSIHVETPEADVPGQVWLEVPASICLSCHDPENSPRFDYDKYLPLVLGEGHELQSNGE